MPGRLFALLAMSPIAGGGSESAHGPSVPSDRIATDSLIGETRRAHPVALRIIRVESLDDVIDAMIADRVIHRHRRKWLMVLALVVVLALVILVLGGWKKRAGAAVDTVDAPYTVDASQFEYGIKAAKIVRTPKSEYQKAEAKVVVSLEALNTDEETHASASINGDEILLVVADGEPLESSVKCKNEFGYDLVYGLPRVECTAEYEVAPDYADTHVKVGVIGRSYSPEDSLVAGDDPVWQQGDALIVVQMTATVETEKQP
jgi:hypothetical protein